MDMKKKLLFNADRLSITIRRLCAELVEQHTELSKALLIGLQPRGVFLSKRLSDNLQALGHQVALGEIDPTFHRDDIHTSSQLRRAYPTRLEESIEGKEVILIDDVLYTGRTVRAALDAILAYGRPRRVELLVLIDRVHSRDIPIESTYTGCCVSTLLDQRVELKLTEQGNEEDGIWLVQKEVNEHTQASFTRD